MSNIDAAPRLISIASAIIGSAILAGCSVNESPREGTELAQPAASSLVQLVDLQFGWGIRIGLASDNDGNVYVADNHRNRIVRVAQDGTWVVIAGSGELGYRDGPGAIARFGFPQGVTVDGDGNVFVADTSNDLIRKISPQQIVTTVAGDYRWYQDSNMRDRNLARDGRATQARFHSPAGIALDKNGFLYVADSQNARIRRLMPGGVVSTLSGIAPFPRLGYVDGAPDKAVFFYPGGIAVGPDGNLYVADNHAIRKIAPDGTVSTLAGGLRARIAATEGAVFRYTGGFADGRGPDAEFAAPVSIAADSKGIIYVADENNNAIRRVTPDGDTTTLFDLRSHYPAPTNPPTALSGAPLAVAVLPNDRLVIATLKGIFIAPSGLK